jgi:gamma-glutamyltranspeptidase / glutathione hydrolase
MVVRSTPVLVTAILLGLLACAMDDHRSVFPERPQPDGQAQRFMVSAANPHAVEAGLSVLRKGGTAVDAAVAVQMVLGFAEPSESGIGGGGFLLHRDASTGIMRVYDGRETAPAAAGPNRFLLPGGMPLPFWAAVVSGRSVGVPGLVAMLHQAHQRHGHLPWHELFEPAVALAQSGVPMPFRLRGLIAQDPSLWIFSDLRQQFVLPAREDEPVLTNPDLARTYQRIAGEGPKALSSGKLAEEIVSAASRRVFGSDMTFRDLQDYSPLIRDPVCGGYREWSVCGPPPPSAGGIGVLQILGMLEHFAMSGVRPGSVEAVHLLAEAGRLAHGDRVHVADPAFSDVPVRELIAKAGTRRIDPAARREPDLMHPNDTVWGIRSPDERLAPGTSHCSIVDGQGNVVSMTGSIEAPFGSRIMVGGFLLNNQLTDFSFLPIQNGRADPNGTGPGKRPRSAMSPTIVLDPDGEVRLVIGSRGGERIVAYVAKTIVGVLDWDLSVQEAIALPNVVGRDDVTEIEQGTDLETLAGDLERMNHRVRIRPLASGLHGIERIPGGWRGGADPRLDGIARGD